MIRQRAKTWGLTIGLAAMASMLLSACAGDPVAPLPCPEILIPIDGSKVTTFRPGPGRDIIDVVQEVQVAGFAHGCVYETDETGAGEVQVELIPAIESARGPANTDGVTNFEYYVAIVSPDKDVLEKKRFPVTIDYPSNMTRITWRRDNPISLRIPLAAGDYGESYTIFLGLQMTRDELEYQRKVR